MEYVLSIAIMVCIYAILALSLNLVVGYSGLLSLAHSAFYGIGAYATAIGLTRYGLGFFSAAALGLLVTMTAALLIGSVLSRFHHDFYTLCSLGFAAIVYGLLLNLEKLTNGPLGVPGIGRPHIFGLDFTSNVNFLCLLIAAVVLTALLLRRVVRSPFGRVLMALREDEEMTQVFGFQTVYFKLMAFVLSAMLASMAGSFFASYISFIDPSSFTLRESILVSVMIIVGGLASIRGSILGAVVLVVLPEGLRFLHISTDTAAQVRQMLYGLALVVLMFYRPQGIVGRFRM
jgi:branched-chain amino acid transport system permease protein